MTIQLKSFQYFGLEKQFINVEAIRFRGLATLNISGLPDTALKESKEKIKQVVSELVDWGPLDKVMVELSPADQIKSGKHLELAIALACLIALDRTSPLVDANTLSGLTFAGELGLGGDLRDTDLTEALRYSQLECFVGPQGYKSLDDLWHDLKERREIKTHCSNSLIIPETTNSKLPHVEERYWERFCLLAASVAKLPALLIGPPGVGKSHLASWAAQLVHRKEELVKQQKQHIWRLAERSTAPLIPILRPHAKTQLSEFKGVQRSNSECPGIFSLAHGGVLILDEFAEMHRDVREILRNVLDTKQIEKNSRMGRSRWPADFWLLLTSNPCPCGFALGSDLSRCRCSDSSRLAYQNRISGPILSRLGLTLFMDEKSYKTPTWLIKDFLDSNDSIQIRIKNAEESFENKYQAVEKLLCIYCNDTKHQFSERKFLNTSKILTAMHVISETPVDTILPTFMLHQLAAENLFKK